MNQEQKDAVTAWRKEQSIDRCMACGYDGEMKCAGIVAALTVGPGGEVSLGDETSIIGMVPVVCPNCAYMMLHEPVTMGLVEPGSMQDYKGG